MGDDFLSKFVGNQGRAKLMRVFVLNQMDGFTVTSAAKMAGVSLKAAESETRMLSQMGIIKILGKLSNQEGKSTTAKDKKREQVWTFNAQGKHSSAISKFIFEVAPPRYDNVVPALRGTGRPTAVILSGCFVGDLSRPADLIVAGDSLNESRLERAVRTLEPSVGRELRYASFTTPEFRYRLTIQDKLIRDTLDYPHLVLLDRTRLL